jgi:hypothetical protein
MKGPSERELAEFFDTYLAKKYRHLVTERFFGATIAAVNSSLPWTVEIVRAGETASDGSTGVVLATSYLPQVGDAVECVWRDDNVWSVLGPLGLPPLGLTKIAEVVVQGTAAAAIDINNLPQNFKDLMVTVSARTDSASVGTYNDNALIQFNGDTTAADYASYYYGEQQVGGAAAFVSGGGPGNWYFALAGSGASSVGRFSVTSALISAYSAADRFKQWVSSTSSMDIGNTGSAFTFTGEWDSLAPITSLHVWADGANLIAGTRLTVYGLP